MVRTDASKKLSALRRAEQLLATSELNDNSVCFSRSYDDKLDAPADRSVDKK
jgi:hypothetical protein